MWEWIKDIYCPFCAAKSLWAGAQLPSGRVAYCIRCNSRVVLRITPEHLLSSAEQEQLRMVRHTANVDSNSAVGAFG